MWIGVAFIACGCVATPSVTLTPTMQDPLTAKTLPPEFTRTPSPTSTSFITPTPGCEEEVGRLERTSYPGSIASGDISVIVYVPPCYDFSDDDYPVLYVLHGYPLDETHWIDLGVDGVAESGISEGLWGPFLIVLPLIPDPLNTHSDGGPGSYEEEFMKGLVPFIEEGYRTGDTPQQRALAGVSRGGVWALEIGFRNPDYFGIVAALSPALHVNQARPAYDPFQIVRIADVLPEKIFLSAGSDEGGFLIKTEELVQLLQSEGIPHTYLRTTGAHVDSTWQGVMQDLLLFVTESWQHP